MLKAFVRLGAAAALVVGLSLVPTAGATSPGPAPYPVTQPYQVGDKTLTPIQHLVVVFQENVSYDHYFGTYPHAANPAGEPAFTAAPGTPSSNNYISHPDLLTSNPNQSPPFRLDRSEAVTCDQDHDYDSEQKAFDGSPDGSSAKMDNFVQVSSAAGNSAANCAHGAPETMGYFDGNTVTGLWNMAQHFSMSDNSFGSTFGPSTPGALNLVAGQTHGVSATNITGSTDGSTAASGACTTASGSTCNATGNYSANRTVVGDPDPLNDDCANPARTQVQLGNSSGGGTGPLTIGDNLSAKNISWGWFQGGFRPTAVSNTGTATCGSKHLNNAGNFISDYNAHHAAFQYFGSTENAHHVSPPNPDMIGQNDTLGINHQYDESDFYTALQNNNLPAVTFLKGANYQDGHAGTTESDPLGEQHFLTDVVNSVETSPSWASTAVVVMYDDSDGWYDHVFHAPVNDSADPQYDFLNSGGVGKPGSACGTAQSSAFPLGGPTFQDRCGPGPRLPLLVISPWAKQNFIDHSFTDQSSVIKFIQENWSVGSLGGGAFESLSGLTAQGTQGPVGSGDLMNMFDFNQNAQRAPAVLFNDQTGEVQQVLSPNGPGDGQKGDHGDQGGQGPQGGQGGKGDRGGRGPRGQVAHVLCSVRVGKRRRITVTCREVGTGSSKRHATRVTLSRGHRTLASGRGRVALTRLTARHGVRRGLYLLSVSVPGAARDTQAVWLS